MNDVELGRLLEYFRYVEALSNLWIEVRIFGPPSRDDTAQNGGRLRIACGEESDVVPPRDEPFSQKRGKQLPRPIVARWYTP